MAAKFRAAQLVYLDGKNPVKIRRVVQTERGYEYELRETGEMVPEDRLSLLKK